MGNKNSLENKYRNVKRNSGGPAYVSNLNETIDRAWLSNGFVHILINSTVYKAPYSDRNMNLVFTNGLLKLKKYKFGECIEVDFESLYVCITKKLIPDWRY